MLCGCELWYCKVVQHMFVKVLNLNRMVSHAKMQYRNSSRYVVIFLYYVSTMNYSKWTFSCLHLINSHTNIVVLCACLCSLVYLYLSQLYSLFYRFLSGIVHEWLNINSIVQYKISKHKGCEYSYNWVLQHMQHLFEQSS